MSEWDEKLNSILSDPEAMSQIMSLAQSLSGQGEHAEDPSAEGTPVTETGPDEESGLPGGLDPELLRRIRPLMEQMNRPESNETAAFLRALRPFLSEKRRDKVERAAQLARVIHLAKSFLTT